MKSKLDAPMFLQPSLGSKLTLKPFCNFKNHITLMHVLFKDLEFVFFGLFILLFFSFLDLCV
ncbi:hypothetical protein HanIR_Chr01g0040861 [Helianthus annuus]|nr:hypothetical protein HanIR_Chr01g0040861 [Helianthus annuus]